MNEVPHPEKSLREKEKAYKKAQKELDDFLGPRLKGTLNSRTAQWRKMQVKAETQEHGEGSIFSTFKKHFLPGNSLMVSTLNLLSKLNVHTTTQLLEFDPDIEQDENTGFGKQKAEMVRKLQAVVRTERDLHR